MQADHAARGASGEDREWMDAPLGPPAAARGYEPTLRERAVRFARGFSGLGEDSIANVLEEEFARLSRALSSSEARAAQMERERDRAAKDAGRSWLAWQGARGALATAEARAEAMREALEKLLDAVDDDTCAMAPKMANVVEARAALAAASARGKEAGRG